MNKFFVGFEKRASSWDVADDFATDMRSKKSPLAELATNFAANGSVPENSSDRKNLKREYIKYHKAYINDTVSSRKADWKKMKDSPKDTVSSGLKGSAIMSLLGMGLGGMGGAALGAPLKLLAKTRGIGKAMAPIGAAAGGLAGGVAGYKAGRSNPYYNMSEKGLKSSVDKEYDAPLHYINHQPFKKKVRK